MSFLITAEELNQHIVCKICNGYLREAYTIKDCLHTFCKSCLFDTFTKGIKVCPHCQSELAADPYKSALKDNTVQGIVDSIFPHFYRDDMREEAEFYRQRGISLKHGQGSHIGMLENNYQHAMPLSVSHSTNNNNNNIMINGNDNGNGDEFHNNQERNDLDQNQGFPSDINSPKYGVANDAPMEVEQPDGEEKGEEEKILDEKEEENETEPAPPSTPVLVPVVAPVYRSKLDPVEASVMSEAPVPLQVSKQQPNPKPELSIGMVVASEPQQKQEKIPKSRPKNPLSQADHMVPRQIGYKPKPGRDKKNHQALIKIFARLDVPDAQILPILDRPTLRTNMSIRMSKVQKHIQKRLKELYADGKLTDGSEVVPADEIVLSCRGVDIDPNVDLEDVLDNLWQAEIEDSHIVLNFHRDPATVSQKPPN